MEHYFNKISQALEGSSLSERERLDMRLSLQTFMNDHPAEMSWHRRLFSQRLVPGTQGVFAAFGVRASAFVLVLVLAAGVGTSYAAQSSLPGSLLYGVKVAFNEPLERATVASSQTQTQWDITLANRRLTEAETLAAQKDLTPQNVRIVQTQLDNETHDFDAAVAATAASASSSAAIAVSNDQSDLEAALSAHVAVLAEIASSSPSVDHQIQPILAAIQTRAAKAAGARMAALAEVNDGSTSTEVKIAAAAEEQAAVNGLSGVRAMARTMAPRAAAFSADASATQQTIRDGDDKLAKGRYGQAFTAFQSAALSAQEAQASGQAQQNLDIPTIVVTAASISATTSSSTATSTGQTTVNAFDQ